MLAMAGTHQTFFMDQLVQDVQDVGVLFFEKDVTRLAIAVFFFCFFFHLVAGAGELAEQPNSCRFFKPRWWLRIVFSLALLIGYRPMFEGFARSALPNYMTSFAGSWLEIWNGELEAKDKLLKMHHENQEVKQAEVTTTRQGSEDQAWWSKAMAWSVDGGGNPDLPPKGVRASGSRPAVVSNPHPHFVESHGWWGIQANSVKNFRRNVYDVPIICSP